MRPVEFIIKEGDKHLSTHSGLALIGPPFNATDSGKTLKASYS